MHCLGAHETFLKILFYKNLAGLKINCVSVYSQDFYFIGVSDRDPDEIVEATIKYDGSLGIAFVWNGEVMVTTRRRMDSQQAIWAKQWIKDHCNLTRFQAGYTYLFEIIYQNNTVIVNYLFEGLVLLAITDEIGHELPYEELLQYARAIGFFMVAPRITGSYSDILWYCGGIESSQEPATPNWRQFTSGAQPVNEKRQEGWVVKFNDGSRQKIVYSWWKNASKLADLVHPQVVWLLLKHDKLRDVFANAPYHFLVEIRHMVQAIGRKFEETLALVERCMKRTHVHYCFHCGFDDWWPRKVDAMVEYVQKNEEITSVPNNEGNDRLRQIFNVLEPHFGKRFNAGSPMLVCEESEEFDTHNAVDVDRYRSPFYKSINPNVLRFPILNYICPTSHALDGYEPGDNFKQTWCKGWQKLLMIDQWQFVQIVLQRNNDIPLFLQLPAEVIVMILNFLDQESLVAVAKVCVHLRKIAKSCKPVQRRNKKPMKIQRARWASYEATYRYTITSSGGYSDYDDDTPMRVVHDDEGYAHAVPDDYY